jgi:nitrogen-specific signal transduction histidine kinase
MMILIVSADSSDIDHLQTLLEGQSSFLAAKSRAEAFELARHNPIRLAIVHFEEPFTDAYDTLQGLLDLKEDLSILLIHDPKHQEAVIPLIQAGLVVPLEKPFTPADLKEKLEQFQVPFTETPASQEVVTTHPQAHEAQEPIPEIDPVSMDRLIMDLAHRLKNPLVAIRTFTSLFKERVDDAQFQKDFYQTMRQEVERMDSLIDQLIEFSELPDPSGTLHPVVPIVEEAVKTSQDRLKNAKITLQNSLDNPSLTLWVDKEQMIYALAHLLTGLGSDMTRSREDSKITVNLRQGEGEYEGIEILLQKNGPFFQDRTHYFGLELFMAKRIIERQNGVVQWEVSAEGQTSVRVFLPTYSPTSPAFGEITRGPCGQVIPPYAERRKRQLAINFRNRRGRQRRLYTRSSYFPDRRRTASATA